MQLVAASAVIDLDSSNDGPRSPKISPLHLPVLKEVHPENKYLPFQRVHKMQSQPYLL